MKHISGTNMSTHIDKFEKICGQMVSCGFVPEQEEKIDWFLASVHERTYEAMYAHALHQPTTTGYPYLQSTNKVVHAPVFLTLSSLPN